MRKKQLGKTGLLVSDMGFGGIPITRLSLEEAACLVKYGYDQGINFFDTAHLYGDSEEKMGAALKTVRGKTILATKTAVRDGKGALEQLETSLKRLRTDYIDLYQMHNISNQESMDQVLAPGGAHEAMVKAQRDGKIRHIGFSTHNPDIAAKVCETGLFATVQVPFNFIEKDPEDKLFGSAREREMGIIAMKPLGGGLLDRPDLCFRFLQQYHDVVPIPGMQSKEEVDQNIRFHRDPQAFTPQDLEDMEKIRAEIGTRFCHRCEYCQPCPEGVLIWRVLLFNAQSRRFPPQMSIRMSKAPMETAEHCVQCGQCEEKCPYELPVSEMIQESLDHYRRFCEIHGQ
jgi:predicted aldo/keto reductase-like oxidoreductase